MNAPVRDKPPAVALSLVSHTNAGKTTLARTLLGRDVGAIRDEPHVTEFADVFEMVHTEAGEALLLWDTPGFGDSIRLARRLRQADQPIGWFLAQVWDRFRDRPLWATQQAVRNVREEADVVLYLVNAAESPEAAAYVAPEMEVLAWIGKPVVVLLNQLGPPGDARTEAADVERWRAHLAGQDLVRAVLPLDAFARCWVQELTLMRVIEEALQGKARDRMARLAQAWRARREAEFDAAVLALAGSLARTATTRVMLPEAATIGERLKRIGTSIGALAGGKPTPVAEVAANELARQWDDEVRKSTAELIALHGLAGEAQGEILQQLAGATELRLRVDEGRAAVLGGVVTGALAGLKADLASGGLTLGGGLLAGGLLGALGAAGVARGINLVRGTQHSWATWNVEALRQMLQAAMLRYLAVAHFGRGRGDWRPAQTPASWDEAVAAVAREHAQTLDAIWESRAAARGASQGGAEAAESTQKVQRALQPCLREMLLAVLDRLYPKTAH
jgi:hypothetical protein